MADQAKNKYIVIQIVIFLIVNFVMWPYYDDMFTCLEPSCQ